MFGELGHAAWLGGQHRRSILQRAAAPQTHPFRASCVIAPYATRTGLERTCGSNTLTQVLPKFMRPSCPGTLLRDVVTCLWRSSVFVACNVSCVRRFFCVRLRVWLFNVDQLRFAYTGHTFRHGCQGLNHDETRSRRDEAQLAIPLPGLVGPGLSGSLCLCVLLVT